MSQASSSKDITEVVCIEDEHDEQVQLAVQKSIESFQEDNNARMQMEHAKQASLYDNVGHPIKKESQQSIKKEPQQSIRQPIKQEQPIEQESQQQLQTTKRKLDEDQVISQQAKTKIQALQPIKQEGQKQTFGGVVQQQTSGGFVQQQVVGDSMQKKEKKPTNPFLGKKMTATEWYNFLLPMISIIVFPRGVGADMTENESKFLDMVGQPLMAAMTLLTRISNTEVDFLGYRQSIRNQLMAATAHDQETLLCKVMADHIQEQTGEKVQFRVCAKDKK